MIVIDASALVEILFATTRGREVEQRVFGTGETLHAPHLLDLEVTQVIRRYLRANYINQVRAQQVFEDLLGVKYKRYPPDVFLRRIWALRDNFTAYDATYIALAEAIGATVVTCDAKMASGRAHNARVELV